MKAIIENIQHFSLHDGPGTRTTIFFKGCPLSCIWCSNPTTQSFKKEILFKAELCTGCQNCATLCPQNAINYTPKAHIDREKCNACGLCINACRAQALIMAGQEYELDEVFNIIKQDIMFYQNSGGGVTFSGGEMLSHTPFVLALIEKCKKLNIHTCAETSGFGPYKDLLSVVNALNMVYFDVKHIESEKHISLTGKDNKVILSNLAKLLSETSTPIHIRLPLIPTINDDDAHLIAYAQYMSQLRGFADLEVLPYHRLGSSKYAMIDKEYTLEEIKPATSEVLAQKVALIREHAGNIKVICTG